MENNEEKLLRIGELAKLSGVSVKALHVYEKKNIIKPVKIDEFTGYRYYSPDQFRFVEALIELQDMGFSLNEISKILSGNCSKEEVADMFDEKKILLQAADIFRRLHSCGEDTGVKFEVFEMAALYEKIIVEGGVSFYDDYADVKRTVMEIKAEVEEINSDKGR